MTDDTIGSIPDVISIQRKVNGADVTDHMPVRGLTMAICLLVIVGSEYVINLELKKPGLSFEINVIQ